MTFFSFVGIATVGALIDEFVHWTAADRDEKKDKKSVIRRQTKSHNR